MTDRAQINLKLPLRQKAEWERAVAQTADYRSVSHLIRAAVERELAGSHERTPSAGVSDDALAGVREDMSDLRSAVSDVQRRVEAMHDATDAGPAGSDLKAEVWAALPEDGDGVTPEAVADAIGGPVEPRDAVQALAAMQADGHVTTDDGTHYRRA